MSKPPPSTTSQALDKDDALHDRYKGVEPFDGIDVDGSKWHTFKDQLKAATDVGSARTKAIVYGNQAPVTVNNAAVEAGIMFSDLQARDPTAYDKLWDKDYWVCAKNVPKTHSKFKNYTSVVFSVFAL